MAVVGKLKRKTNPWKTLLFGQATFTIGAKTGGNTINVAVVLKDDNGRAISSRGNLKVYLSDVATGAGLTGTTPGTSVAIGTNGVIIEEFVTKKRWEILSDAQGRFDLSIVDGGTPAWYMVLVFPDGSIQVSNIIQF